MFARGQRQREPDEPSDPVEVVRSAYPQLLRAAKRLAGSASEAEDLVQEAFVETLARYPSFRGLTQPLGYLTTVLYRTAFHRRRVRSSEVTLDLQERLETVEPDRDAPATVAEALASLGPRQRACVMLRYLHDLDDAEIAAALGCRASTVRSQIARGLANARERMRDADP